MKHRDFQVRPGHAIRLDDLDPSFTAGFKDKDDAHDRLERDVERLAELQDVFAAAQTHALLIVLQGMDTSGKDGAVKHVMSGVNPQGVDVYSFKQPTHEELSHDFLWRYEKVLPGRGRFGIFNRSYYEEVLVVRVHRELLTAEDPSAADRAMHVWKERFEDINAFERHLVRNGTVLVKFFLHISKDEQRSRLLKRIEDPDKNWKFSDSDAAERRYWDRYMLAYEHMINNTSTEWAPWYVIPSDHKWFMRAAIARILIEQLESLRLKYPVPTNAQHAMLEDVRKELAH
jgi:PPK2 family polyphosphate:nucleotide phosphotransferase